MRSIEVKTAIIGLGRWGKNLAREFAKGGSLIAYEFLGSDDTEEWAQKNLPLAHRADLRAICEDPAIDAVAIATPIPTHTEIARELLQAGKHVLVEKPLAPTSVEAEALVALAHERNRTLGVGYVFLHHPVYREMKRRLAARPLASVRIEWKKYGSFAESIENNLLTHHLSLALDLCGTPANGHIEHGSGIESPCDRIVTTLSYDEFDFVSDIDRASTTTFHVMQVTLTDGTVYVWDGSSLFERQGGSETLVYENTEQPLGVEVRAFLDAVAHGEAFVSSGRFGSDVIKLQESLRS